MLNAASRQMKWCFKKIVAVIFYCSDEPIQLAMTRLRHERANEPKWQVAALRDIPRRAEQTTATLPMSRLGLKRYVCQEIS